MARYKILCTVSGGVTGFRQSYLKVGPRQSIEYSTEIRAEAEAEANKLNKEMNHKGAKANFNYSVVKG